MYNTYRQLSYQMDSINYMCGLILKMQRELNKFSGEKLKKVFEISLDRVYITYFYQTVRRHLKVIHGLFSDVIGKHDLRQYISGNLPPLLRFSHR